MNKEDVTSNYVYDTMERLNNIKNYMLLNQNHLTKLNDEQKDNWGKILVYILEIQNRNRLLYYITDDLRKEEILKGDSDE